ncbi:hypothetical protein D5S17_23240 [Pseudonocardiaceae bacterium YIM PH 21723]|nr:hypothetical protein D5S17_23240 [Pseudonocardiaceae bacterium YIM PH 21723]
MTGAFDLRLLATMRSLLKDSETNPEAASSLYEVLVGQHGVQACRAALLTVSSEAAEFFDS